MLKPSLILLALLFSANVSAENWQDLGAAEDGSVKQTIDADSIKPYNDFFYEAWGMVNFSTEQTEKEFKFRSIKMQQVFDCKGHRTAIPQHNVYSGANGTGNIVYQHKPAENEELDMQDTSPDSPNGAALIFVCHYVNDHPSK